MQQNVLFNDYAQIGYRTDAEFVREMDAADPLAGYRDRFYIPLNADGSEVIYFTGNSLGLMPKTARGFSIRNSTIGKNWQSKDTSKPNIRGFPITNF